MLTITTVIKKIQILRFYGDVGIQFVKRWIKSTEQLGSVYISISASFWQELGFTFINYLSRFKTIAAERNIEITYDNLN